MNPFLLQPVPTGDAAARYERLSHGGTTWHDLMPTPANGTDGGAVGFWPNFNDAGYVTIGQPTKLNFTSAFTITAWCLQTREAPPRDNQERVLSRDAMGGSRSYTLSQDDATGVFSFFVWDDAGAAPPYPGYQFVQSPGFPDEAWHFVAAVNEGAGNDMKMYIDGELVVTGAGKGVKLKVTAANAEFGRRQDGGGPDFYQGKIDTGRLYPRVLSADEILRDYYAGKPAHP